ncbi:MULTISPECIES: DEAD/DEAH box helicase [unclassified Mycolicibacterium]|uniref:DEAD/DEAH box helicase n=1 Tax=unclassified Mycolicibacterium TaxID=2636767 RepID=UPI001309A4FD|nr:MULTISPECIES: DEAD/DEAH box helicase [unclassified Mycolicibacterium]MUL81348.1 DEAD/DEAH box helicase [Mycolicibacterium sp. CBMA 329]MUL87114.1 DEAD/DEAH box helicase [Mycolicibacterium sp. CBMA 331]MUL98604.1 DEAD/DEAH box helicase [Mycolicibacterium sp. CBMA 334]MUM28338.1 DEAD/DEAH box helicase [Mycolicibacterium sp. CBMA 295]MUM37411.1 DEAD/DEAH box helicase [Mycolicibacterium sp. CBMA 247]
MPTFADLGLPAEIVATLAGNGVHSPFPIQAATLPDSLKGRDVLGRGRTGSGKTYAFLLPLVARLSTSGTRRAPNRPRALILAPTRELVTQIEASLRPLAAATGLSSINIFGGVGPGPQIAALKRGVDIVIACPGRLEDHMRSGHADLSAVEITVLDEADHMADLGFLPGVKRLLDRTPKNCQRLLFSATLDAGVDVLVERYLHDPVVHSVDSAQSPVTAMVHHVLHVDNAARVNVVADLAAAPGRTIVFARTKHGAKNLARQLNSRGVSAVELHGNLSQNARTRNLTAFSDGSAAVLVATDIAARGIHVDDVSLVVHADPPVEHKAYLHRSGRTARAGNEGTVVTLMHDAQVSDVRNLTRKAGVKPTITRINNIDHPVLQEIAPGDRVFGDPIRPEPAAQAAPAPRRQSGQPGKSGQQQRRSRPNGSSARSGGGAPAARSGAGGQHGARRRPHRSNDSSR